MTFQLSQSQVDALIVAVANAAGIPPNSDIEVLKDAVNALNVGSLPINAAAFVPVYEQILSGISVPAGDAPLPGVDKSTWVFLKSAILINESAASPQGFAARRYTELQYILRMENPDIPDVAIEDVDDLVSQMSNGIALSIARTIINDDGLVPTVVQIGTDDATTVVDGFFHGEAGGWVGNPTFEFFGTDAFFGRLDPASSLFGTYDLFSAFYTTQKPMEELGTVELFLLWWADNREWVIANNSIGTAATLDLISDLSADVDSWIANNYHGSFTGLFETFFNPNGGNNPLSSSAPQIYVGHLHADNLIEVLQIPIARDRLIVRGGNEADDVVLEVIRTGIVDGGTGHDTLEFRDSLAPMLPLSVRSLPRKVDVEQGIENEGISIRAAENPAHTIFAYNFEVLKLSKYDDDVELDGTQVPSLRIIDAGDGNDTINVSATTIGVSETEYQQLRVLAGDGNDNITAQNLIEGGTGQTLGEEVKELYIDAGIGNDTVYSDGAAEIFLGSGDDVLLQAGAGSIVHGGEGADTFNYTNGVLIADATGEDSLIYQGAVMGLALAWGGAESQWATFLNSPLLRVAFNPEGELVVQDAASFARAGWDPANSALYNLYFANGNRDPNAAPEDRTAGMQVASVEIDAVRLMDLQAGQLKGMFALLDLLVDNYNKAVKDNNLSPGGDPLVLDLDGDGLELMARSSVAPLFDVDGDMFAERTGWVMRDDGFLTVDANANGKIDDVSEMFGSQTSSGFVELASYDSNSDGKVDASDAKFGDLRIWQDKDGDAVTDAGELLTLSEAKIVSISTGSTPLGTKNALNTVAAEGTFTREDSTTGGIYDVRFATNDFKSQYIGDSSVSSTVETAQPNLKGRGTCVIGEFRLAA